MFPIVTISFPTQNFIIKKLPNIQKVGEIAQEELNPKLKNHKYIYICVCVYVYIYIYTCTSGVLRWLSGKESACNTGDVGSIRGSGKFPGEGNSNPLQYFCLGNSMDREAWQTTVHGITVRHDLVTKQQ